jgi:uncharacterized protein YqeY
MKMGIMNKMNTKKQLESDLKDAMRSGDDLRKRTLRMVFSAIKNAEIERRNHLGESDILGIIQKEIKSRRETIQDAERANRPDLVMSNQEEISVLETYLPKQLNNEELATLIREAIAETGASSLNQMGQVMKVLMPRIKGRADGGEVSQMVRKMLG